MFGASLIYVIKGINTWAIINIAKDYVFIYIYIEFIIPPTENKLNYPSDIRVMEYTKVKYTHSIVYVAYNLLTVTLTVMIIGSFFGKEATVGLLVGAVISGALLQFNGLIKGTTLENSRIYNESKLILYLILV